MEMDVNVPLMGEILIVMIYPLSYLKHNLTSEAFERSLILDTNSYTKLVSSQDKEVRKWSEWWNGGLDEYSYILFPICLEHHYSLVIVCFVAREESCRILMLHMDSLSLHNSDKIFDTIEWGLKKMWSGDSSNFPQTTRMTIQVPQQPNVYDCGLFVFHMMKLFLEQAPRQFDLDYIDMFGETWFNPGDVCRSREVAKKYIEEEMKRRTKEKPLNSEGTSKKNTQVNGDFTAEKPLNSEGIRKENTHDIGDLHEENSPMQQNQNAEVNKENTHDIGDFSGGNTRDASSDLHEENLPTQQDQNAEVDTRRASKRKRECMKEQKKKRKDTKKQKRKAHKVDKQVNPNKSRSGRIVKHPERLIDSLAKYNKEKKKKKPILPSKKIVKSCHGRVVRMPEVYPA